MKTTTATKWAVIKSNHGNHTGFNRKWTMLNQGFPFETLDEAIKYLNQIIDECEDDIEESERTEKGSESYDYDGCFYKVISSDDLDQFNGGHYGYLPNSISEALTSE